MPAICMYNCHVRYSICPSIFIMLNRNDRGKDIRPRAAKKKVETIMQISCKFRPNPKLICYIIII